MDLLVSGLAAAVFLWFAGQLCEERPLMTHGLRLHPGLPLGSSDSYYLNQHCCLPNLRLQEPAQGLDPRTMTGSYGTAGVRKTTSCGGRHLLLGMVLTLGFLTKRKRSVALPPCLPASKPRRSPSGHLQSRQEHLRVMAACPSAAPAQKQAGVLAPPGCAEGRPPR